MLRLTLTTSSLTDTMKYNEKQNVEELLAYISSTYSKHYSSGLLEDSIQTLDLIEACGDAQAFCRSNILKYASRYDKKGSARQDILKVLHYGVLLMHFHHKETSRYAAADFAAQE